MDYGTVKVIHQSAVALSFVGFLVRSGASLSGASWVQSRAARTLPHVVDTVLLVSALALVWMLRLNPYAAPWLTAKIIALLIYIALGFIALRPRLPRRVRLAAWLAALASFGYIVAVAFTKNPLGYFP